MLSLLGYLHGYKIGQDYALQLQPYFISPVIIIPTVNQQQSVTIQDAINDENYQESGSTIQTITSAKLISNGTDSNKVTKSMEKNALKENIKECENQSTRIPNVTESLRQASFDSTTIAANTTEIVPTIIVTTDETKETTTKRSGPYTLPSYNDTKIESLKLTTSTPDEDPVLPPVSDNRWQNFTLRANLSSILDENMTMINEQQNNTVTPFATENTTVNPTLSTIMYYNGRYPNSLYNNAMIDQLSITTNSYTNEESPLLPSQNDGWSRFSSYNKVTYPKYEGFKPLAGLYYDGFLHRPLKKFGFIPDNYVY